MGLPNLGHAVIINNLATQVPDTVQYVETFTTTLTKIGFKVNQYKDMNFQVTFKSVDRHAVALPNAFSLRT